ncbi:hypothetical protein D3C71_2080680 [compost metagenome]
MLVYSSSSRLVAADLKREASSVMRVSTTLRAVMSVGALTTFEKPLSISFIAAPRPLSPPAKASCIWVSDDAHARSAAWIAPAVFDWRLSSAL